MFQKEDEKFESVFGLNLSAFEVRFSENSISSTHFGLLAYPVAVNVFSRSPLLLVCPSFKTVVGGFTLNMLEENTGAFDTGFEVF